DRQGRGRTVVQRDFRRRRRALGAPCRKGQARTRDEEVATGGREMAQIWRHRRAIAAALSALAALIFEPALAQDQRPQNGTDLFERPVLAVDPGTHTAEIQSLAVDADGRFAVTGSDDRTVRIWSVADGKLLRTIWVPVGPQDVGDVYAVAMSPDGSIIAAGG